MAENYDSHDQYNESMKKRRKMLESVEPNSDTFWNNNSALTGGNTPSSSRKLLATRQNSRYNNPSELWSELHPKINRRNYPALTSQYFDKECNNAVSSNQAFTNLDE